MKTYRISEVAKLVNLSIDTLHYYEKIGLISGLSKNKRGYKVYTERDVLSLRFTINLKKTDMPLSQIKQYIDLFAEGNLDECYKLLDTHASLVKQQIKEREEFLKILNYKLSNFNELVEKKRDKFEELNSQRSERDL
ncbi:MerR family transcriptional regulator [Sporolactobacillus laevolacticus]|uniref:MerR family transcriptional regulator n=1 Tax=Sporolactobacillus laevolacticus TaxID=33018 RepID=UPI0025B56C91|nr:MerR family transcriptional regulator [Sporolactobacillus laevolacticus]MDN3955188.1 MerR family transcriptional regulator [Sporolactobacillus laevolacticus]